MNFCILERKKAILFYISVFIKISMPMHPYVQTHYIGIYILNVCILQTGTPTDTVACLWTIT